MKKDNESLEKRSEELEDKIVELSLKLKNKEKELNDIVELNNLIFKKLIHNLKNPVGVSFSFSEMILESLPNYSPDKLQKHIEIIKNSSDFSLKFLNKLADYSRYQLPQLNFNFQHQNFNKFIIDVIEKAEQLAAKKNITIQYNLPNSSIDFKFDRTELEIAILNIIQNAIRYSSENTNIQIEVVNNQLEIEIIISDNGMGIDEDNKYLIFNEFFVVNTYSDDKIKCIGLGLPIAQKIVKRHGGKITVNSELHVGSVFTITLPKDHKNL
ncbi:sensor histidine kinase [Lutibacter sp.]|uniref:sensor histidine kinase n=1 Tax=Lutibacter sp. TaxID=1925666 RepID=UPI003561AF71